MPKGIYIRTEEHNKNNSIAKTGRILTEEHKKKIGDSHKGRKHTEESKKKMSNIKRKTEKNNHWKGGITKLNIPLYETYVSRLEPIEQCRKSQEGYLEVKCTYCDRWFVPKRTDIGNRIQIINGKLKGESRLYCSTECKSNCPIFYQIKYPKGFKPATSREVQPELRKLVFQRDDWTCIKCKATSNLHCHHIEGIVQNPIESADIDLCVTLCKSCHKEVHRQKDCKYNDLKCKGDN
jgi:hypothetical protein